MRAGIMAAVALATLAGPGNAAEPSWAERTQAIGQAGAMPAGRLDRAALDRLTALGEALFTAKFTTLDGAGRPGATQAIIPTRARNRAAVSFARTSGPDANACSSCHGDPAPGGAGDFVTSTFVSEGFSTAEFDTTDPQFSNERGTNHLFGSGLLELLAREMSAELAAIRGDALKRARAGGAPVQAALITKGVDFGILTAHADGLVDLTRIEGVDTDLVVRPFSQKGVMTSLRQFTINAMNAHHGMQASERYGSRWTGTDDFDDDGVREELGEGDIAALVAWQATLPAPTRHVPAQPAWRAAAERGETLMGEFGCTACHRPALPLESLVFEDPGPVDAPGTLNRQQVALTAAYDLGLLEWARALPRDRQGRVLVPLFGDLKRHQITDRRNTAFGNELLSQRFVDRNLFMTAELWGVASTAPYGHRNDFTTLDAAIRAHGGDAAAAQAAYAKAGAQDRSAIIAFLKTLAIEP